MNRQRGGAVIAATWLIGLGLVFLIYQASVRDWSEVWPLFLVLVGIAGLVSTAVRGGRATRGIGGLWAYTWPLTVTVIGALLLASTTGTISRPTADFVSDAWPWVAIVLGVWFLVGAIVPVGRPDEVLVRPAAGLAEAAIRISFGAGTLTVGPAAPGNLVDGSFAGGVVCRDRAPGRLELEQDVSDRLPWLDHDAAWAVGLASGIPLDLRFDTGAARADLDLRELRIRNLELHTGASSTRLRLPRAAGATTVRAETGMAELVVEVPAGVAARIRGRMALGATEIDEGRFPPTAGGTHESVDYATAQNRVDLDVQGGLGKVRVIGLAEGLAA